jgi:hypothetical protein
MRKYLVSIAAVMLIMPGIYAYYDPTKPTFWATFFFALVTGFLAGMLSPIVFYLATGKSVQQIISSEFSGILSRIYSEYAPQRIYKASARIDDQFNIDLSSSMARSNSYSFLGETGVHVPSRVKAREAGAGDALYNIEIVVGFSREERDLDSNYIIYGANIETRKRIAILAAMLALADIGRARISRNILLYVARGPFGFRFETTDEGFFVTEAPNGLVNGGYARSFLVDRDSILARIAQNAKLIGISGIQPILLNRVDDDQIISALGYSVSAKDLKEANELKAKILSMRHA